MWCFILYNHLYVQSYECRRLGDRFREHLRDVTRNDKDASKPVAKRLNLPTYSIHHMAVSGLSLENYSRSESVIRNPDVCGLTLASLLQGAKLESDVMFCTSCQPVL